MRIITENKKKYRHFTQEERLVLEYYLAGKKHFPKTTNTQKLSEIFNKSRRTIQREIKRGLVEHVKTDLTLETEYNADFAQLKADYEKTAKGARLKIKNDFILADKITDLIKNYNYSPYAVVQYFQLNSWPTETRICEKTIYNYIESKVFNDLTVKDLPNKGIKHKEKQPTKRFSRAACAIRSISNRPDYINNRSEFGLWEIDTVKSCANSTNQCVLTLTERKLRTEILRKLPNAESASVVNELNKIEQEFGKEMFKKIFKSITADCGSEFMDFDGIEKSPSGEKRTELYFAHPYCASERGTNENHNRMLRRFFPKGSNFLYVDQTHLDNIQNWMNNYPRKILNGSTPILELQKELGFNLLL